jgi:exodeoxyribonuclease V alpha subunit
MFCVTRFTASGFKTADSIALRTGIPKNSPFRVDAALLWVLNEAANEGHCYLRPSLIVERLIGGRGKGVIAASGVDVKDVAESNQRIIDDGRCVREGDCVYLKKMWVAERVVAAKVKALIGDLAYDNLQKQRDGETVADALKNLAALVADIESRDGVEYAQEQGQAIMQALINPLSIITGGPGTGKTTAINAIVDIYKKLHPQNDLYLCAPTGRAAKRMSEATGEEAMTIHRLLKYNPADNAFFYGADQSLPGPGLIIVDEASMIDVELAATLLAAVNTGNKKEDDVKETHQVVLVGDIDQLPSVGPGSVLRDLIASSRVPTTRLEFNYRQAGGSRIAELAHRVCQGEMISLKNGGDFEFVAADGGDSAAEMVKWLAQTYVNVQGLNPLAWQVLVTDAPGQLRVKKINEELREIVNPARPDAPTLGGFRLGDKVLVTKNNYNLGVFNGDLGIVSEIGKGNLTVDFGDYAVEFCVEHLELLTLAYASTIHKAQGSRI